MLDKELTEFPEFEHALVQDLHEMIGKFRADIDNDYKKLFSQDKAKVSGIMLSQSNVKFNKGTV
jgi:hypothetical protein